MVLNQRQRRKTPVEKREKTCLPPEHCNEIFPKITKLPPHDTFVQPPNYYPMKNLLLCLLLAFLALSTRDKAQQKHPNIVWIVCEDLSPHLGSYGEKVAQTPVLDQLAKEGVRYTNAFSTAGVCAPSRAAIITGCYQTSIGGHNMRTLGAGPLNKNAYPPRYQSYSALVPVGVKCFSEYLRAAGYYCTNNNKEDYQFEAPVTAWDESGNNAHWRKRKDPQQPFFAVFNLFVTHESQVWARNKEPLLVDPAKVEVPPYYVDNEITRKTIARFLSNVMLMDKQAGELIQQLKDDAVYDDTIIFFYSDHGDGMPFVKRELYDRGLRVPMIIKAPFLAPGSTDNQLISFVDLAPSVLSLAGIPIPKSMQGQAFIGEQKAKQPRKYLFAARDRMDSEYDRVRAVSDGRFKYLRNYRPELPYYQNLAFRLDNPIMTNLLQLKAEGKLNATQMMWFRPNKPLEELFDTQADPYEFKNLATDHAYASKLKELRREHEKWIKQYGDLGAIPEKELVAGWWNGQNHPPVTEKPVVKVVKGQALLTCATAGASIAYRKSVKDTWQVYTKPVQLAQTDSLYVLAQRIGFERSGVVKVRW